MEDAKIRIAFILVFLTGLAFNPSMAQGEEDPKFELSLISPYFSAGKEAMVRISVSSASGKHLNAAMMDKCCYRVKLADGQVLIPKKEGLSKKTLNLGKNAAISRKADISGLFKNLKNQPLEVWWEYEEYKSPILDVYYFEVKLEEVEAVMSTDFGEMVIEFYPNKAPITVSNFVKLSLKGFYDALTFHRIMPGFMIQGGCPAGDGTGDPGYYIKGEFSDISHERGVVSMARSTSPDSGGCQFFIMHADNSGLDYNYAAFGKLTSGYETLDKLAKVQLKDRGGELSLPVTPPIIKKVTIRKKSKE